jgi:hypothetical protein
MKYASKLVQWLLEGNELVNKRLSDERPRNVSVL